METTARKTVAPTQGGRLAGRDYVIVAVFGVLLFAVFMVASMVLSISANTVWFMHSVGAIPAGIIWMYVLARVPKRGAVALMGVLVAVMGLLMGMFWTGPVGIVMGGLAAEFVLGTPERRTNVRRVAAYALFVLCIWVGQISLIFIAGQSYVDLCVAAGMTAEYGQQLVDFVFGPLCLVAGCATVVGSVLGGILGLRVFKKHFARMGA